MQTKSQSIIILLLSMLALLISGCVGALDTMRANIAISRAESMYEQGNYHEASSHYRSAAIAGNPRGQYMLARMYANGQGVVMDQGESLRWMRMAAENAYPAADFEMGVRYLTGDGLADNPRQAVYHFQRGADNEHELSMYHLGFVHAFGIGVPSNAGEALRWFRLADAYGFPVDEGLLSQSGIESYVRGQSRAQPQGKAVPQKTELLNTSDRDDAAVIQSKLAELGFYNMMIDGIWGPGSKNALRGFQKANGLDSDGVWDMQTQKRLFSVY